MYQVFYAKTHEDYLEEIPFLVFQSESDVEAFQFAMSLHQASNVSHCIVVKAPAGKPGATDFSFIKE